MRKADYLHLAHIVKTMRQTAEDNKNAWNDDHQDQKQYWIGWKHCLQHVAYSFADKAHVDFDDFCKACGLNP